MAQSPRIKPEPVNDHTDFIGEDSVMGGTQEAAGQGASSDGNISIKQELDSAPVPIKREPTPDLQITGSREMSLRDLILDAQNRKLPRATLFYIRNQIQKIHSQTKQVGPGTLDSETAQKLKDHLMELAGYRFDDPDDQKLTHIRRVVKLLCNVSLYGDEIADKAKTIYDRWSAGNWESFDLNAHEDDDELDYSDDDSLFNTSDEEKPYISPPPATQSSNGITDPNRTTTGYIMRGINIEVKNGRKSQRLDPLYPKRDAKVFGHNGLRVGDWWPFQLCALRDGAHGARIGGISPSPHGAYSVVISGGAYDEQDVDFGSEVWYSGNMGADDESSRQQPQQTPGVKALMMNIHNGRSIRVIRSGKANTRHAPGVGYRYDGLYRVTEYRTKKAKDGRWFYQFHLVRREDQDPIDHARPNPGERRAFSAL